MSLSSDFDLVWKSYEDKLSSYAAQNSMNNKLTDADDFNAYYKRSIRMWDDESKVQGGFINKWDKEIPGFRNEFMTALNEHQFQDPECLKRPSSIPYIGMTAAITAVGGVIGYLVPAGFILKRLIGNVLVIILAAIVFASVGGGIVKALYSNALAKQCGQCADHFNSQIESLHMKLKGLCDKH